METMTSTLLQQHATQTATTTAHHYQHRSHHHPHHHHHNNQQQLHHLHSHHTTTTTTTTQAAAAATVAAAAMAWSTEKLRFSCVDNIGLRQLWKLIALDSSSSRNNNNNNNNSITTNGVNINECAAMQHSKHNNNVDTIQQMQENCLSNNNNNEKNDFENYMNDYLSQRDILPPHRMSLLKFLALNALELSAPATPALLEHNQNNQHFNANVKPPGWMQLSGHPESIVPTTAGIVRKRVASLTDNEVLAYKLLTQEPQTAKIVPQFYGAQAVNGDNFIELQDLLTGFKDPCVMDIKMGCRTFLESEVTNKTLRPDLYKKMVAVDPLAPTAEEESTQAITKLRYMLFRESMSSSQSKGFRIEALRLRGRPPVKDLKTVRNSDQITQTIEQFLGAKRTVTKELIKRLKHMRMVMEKSAFFQRHEVVGSSIFIVYDDDKVGAWLIDFAKSRPLPAGVNVNHRATWIPGNCEEGLLKGMDELINAFENVYASHGSRKCLQI
ncbi:inositol-trisphosphate 3-kinase homolog isoform X1 [Bactrocera dorsalis]|uniref:Kinase n=1 Tax=Bactrocera dorsalis TaxID=27457 RepID=A0ABM3JG31_BACDO|nr:inositol-trisphosphate 3-kinase homolog isoform X1 [Bactrocera dorsalis]